MRASRARRSFLWRAVSNYAADQSRLNIAEQIIGKKWMRCGRLMQRKTHASESEYRSNGHRWNGVILTDGEKPVSQPWNRKILFLFFFFYTISTRRTLADTARLRRSYEYIRRGLKKEPTLASLSVIPKRGGTKGTYFTSARRYQDGPNPQGRLLAGRNPKLNSVGEVGSSYKRRPPWWRHRNNVWVTHARSDGRWWSRRVQERYG